LVCFWAAKAVAYLQTVQPTLEDSACSYNNNTKWDSGEAAIVNAKVELLNDQGEVLAVQYTDEEGKYSFTNLPADHYKVRFTLPEQLQEDGYTFEGEHGETASMTIDADTNIDDKIVVGAQVIQGCACSDVSSDKADAFSSIGLIMMMLMVLVFGSFQLRRIEE